MHSSNLDINQKDKSIGQQIKLIFGFISICFIWGSSWAVLKIGLEYMPPFFSLVIRFLISTVIISVIIICKRLAIPKGKNFWKLVLILWISSFMIPFALTYWAQKQLPSAIAAILYATFPFWVSILTFWLLPDEKISWRKITGIFLGFTGTLLIFYENLSCLSNVKIYAMAIIIFTAIVQSVGLVFLKKFSKEIEHIWLNFLPIALSIIPIFILSASTERLSEINISFLLIFSLLYLSIFCTTIAFLIYFWLVKNIEAVTLSTTAFLSPVVALLIGIFIMGESFTNYIYIGMFIVLLGVIIVTTENIVSFKIFKN